MINRSKYYVADTDTKKEKFEKEKNIFDYYFKKFGNQKKVIRVVKINNSNVNAIHPDDFLIMCEVALEFIKSSGCIAEYRLITHYLENLFMYDNIINYHWIKVFTKLRSNNDILWTFQTRKKDDLTYGKKYIKIEKEISKKASRFYILTPGLLRKTKIKDILKDVD